MKINKFRFKNFEQAWEQLNEYMVNNQDEVINRGGALNGSEIILHDVIVEVKKPRISPDFNFGISLGYTIKKWSKLISNYVNMNYLDLVKAEVQAREAKKEKNYNISFHFDNAHKSGKDCLISLTFCRRKNENRPLAIYYTRACELTSRAIFDFLLIQRILEYVYGNKPNVRVLCHIPYMFVNAQRFLIYMAYKGKQCVTGDSTKYQKSLLISYQKFMETPPQDIKYKVYRRAALQLQKDPLTGRALSGKADLLAKDVAFPYNIKIRVKEVAELKQINSIK